MKGESYLLSERISKLANLKETLRTIFMAIRFSMSLGNAGVVSDRTGSESLQLRLFVHSIDFAPIFKFGEDTIPLRLIMTRCECSSRAN
jgi:hypothetical protein